MSDAEITAEDRQNFYGQTYSVVAKELVDLEGGLASWRRFEDQRMVELFEQHIATMTAMRDYLREKITQ